MDTQVAPHPSPMSFEEFVDWCDEDTYAEWVDGEGRIMTAPGTRHQQLLLFLATLLKHFAEARRSGEVFAAPFLVRLPRSGPLPDVLFIQREHLDRPGEVYLNGAPDLAIEIVSAESRTRDRQEKREYEEAGIREYWIIDPERKRAEFHVLDENGRYKSLPVDGGVFRSRVLDGLWLRLEWLWQDPLPPLLSVLREWRMVK